MEKCENPKIFPISQKCQFWLIIHTGFENGDCGRQLSVGTRYETVGVRIDGGAPPVELHLGLAPRRPPAGVQPGAVAVVEVGVQVSQLAARPDSVAEHDALVRPGLSRPCQNLRVSITFGISASRDIHTVAFEDADGHHDGGRALAGACGGAADLLVRRHHRAVLHRVVGVGLGRRRRRVVGRTARGRRRTVPGTAAVRVPRAQNPVAPLAHPRLGVEVLQPVLHLLVAALRTQHLEDIEINRRLTVFFLKLSVTNRKQILKIYSTLGELCRTV